MILRCACMTAIICGATLGLQEQGTSSEAEREKDVYRIYSLLLNNAKTSHGPDENPRYLISETTSLPMWQEPCVAADKGREAELAEVLADFERRTTCLRFRMFISTAAVLSR